VRTPEALPYQATLRTTRTRRQIVDDLIALDVPGASVAEHGDTYLVFAPRKRRVYGPGAATATAVAIATVVLVLTAFNVVFVVLLPAALAAYLPLLIGDHHLLAVGVVDDDDVGVTRFTVHGHAWGALKGAIDAYMSHLPEAPPPGQELEEPTPVGAGAMAAAGPEDTAAL
jgi:hypothetical protein